MITIIKGFYPWSLTGMSEDATKLMIGTWTKFFEDYDVVDIEKALMETVRENKTSFPPSVGMIVSNIPERRTGVIPADPITIKRIKPW